MDARALQRLAEGWRNKSAEVRGMAQGCAIPVPAGEVAALLARQYEACALELEGQLRGEGGVLSEKGK